MAWLRVHTLRLFPSAYILCSTRTTHDQARMHSINSSITPKPPASPLKCETDGGILSQLNSLAPAAAVFLRETTLLTSSFSVPLLVSFRSSEQELHPINTPPQFSRLRLYHTTRKGYISPRHYKIFCRFFRHCRQTSPPNISDARPKQQQKK